MPETEITRNAKPLDEIAHLLARWWADILRRDYCPKRGVFSDAMDAMLSMIKERQPKLTPEQCQAFEEALTAVLLDGYDWQWEGKTGHECGLRELAAIWPDGILRPGVDYGPDGILAEAARRAGFDPAYRFPFKTRSAIGARSVQVSWGYGAPYQWLWATKREWARDQAIRRFSEAYPYPEPVLGEEYFTPSYRLRVDQRMAAQTTISDRSATVNDDQPVEAIIAELLRLAEAALAGRD